MQYFIKKNYVFLVGLFSAISLFMEQAITQQAIDIKILLTGLLMAVLGYVANTWKGGGVTVTGILGSLTAVFLQLHQTGEINWTMFGLLAVTKLMAALSTSLQAYKPQD
jgi:uncharacterized membrane protein